MFDRFCSDLNPEKLFDELVFREFLFADTLKFPGLNPLGFVVFFSKLCLRVRSRMTFTHYAPRADLR